MSTAVRRDDQYGGTTSYGVLRAHFQNHYLKYNSGPPTKNIPETSSAARDAALWIDNNNTGFQNYIKTVRTDIRVNFKRKLDKLGTVYQKAIERSINKNCELDCSRRAVQKAVEVFGRDSVLNRRRLSKSAQKIVQDFIDHEKNMLMDRAKVKDVVEWNTYYNDTIRLAEENLRALAADYADGGSSFLRLDDIKDKVQSARKAAIATFDNKTFKIVQEEAAQAGKKLFDFIRSCQDIESLVENYIHPTDKHKKNKSADKDASFWWLMLNSNWDAEKNIFYPNIDNESEPEDWVWMWYSAEELERSCDVYKMYAVEHDKNWSKLFSALGGEGDHQEWIQEAISNQYQIEYTRVKEWEKYSVAGLKFFMLDLLKHYRETGKHVLQQANAEAVSKRKFEDETAKKRKKVAAAAEQRKRDTVTHEMKMLNEIITTIETELNLWLEHKDKNRTLITQNLTEIKTEVEKFLRENENTLDTSALKEALENKIPILEVQLEFGKAGFFPGDIEIWNSSDKATVKYSGAYTKDGFLISNGGGGVLETCKTPRNLRKLIDRSNKNVEKYKLDVRKKSQNLRRQQRMQERKLKRSRQSTQSKKIRLNALKEKEEIQKKTLLRLIQKKKKIPTARVAIDAAAFAQQRRLEIEKDEKEKTRQKDKQEQSERKRKQSAAQNAREARELRKTSLERVGDILDKMETQDSREAVNAIGRELSLGNFSNLTLDDETAKKVSKCKRKAAELNAEKAKLALKAMKPFVVEWLLTLTTEPEISHKTVTRGGKEVWENEIWPLIKDDMKESFEIEEWKEFNEGNYESEESASNAFFREIKSRYSDVGDHNNGYWWTVRDSKNFLVATTWVDASNSEKFSIRPELYTLKVHKDYEKLGVGRYLSYKIYDAMFAKEKNDNRKKLRSSIKNVRWDEVGILLTPSTIQEAGLYSYWVNRPPETYENYDDGKKTFQEATEVDDPAYTQGNVPAEVEYIQVVQPAPVFFKPSHPVHALHASFTAAVKAHVTTVAKLYKKTALRKRVRASWKKRLLSMTKVFPLKRRLTATTAVPNAALMADSPSPKVPAVVVRPGTLGVLDASAGAPPSPPRGMLRG